MEPIHKTHPSLYAEYAHWEDDYRTGAVQNNTIDKAVLKEKLNQFKTEMRMSAISTETVEFIEHVLQELGLDEE